MITEFIILFCATAVLFFIVSGMTKAKFIWIVLPLNVVFLGLLFFSYIQFVGKPIPMDADIPFWKYQTFSRETLATIESYYEAEDLIHFLIHPKNGKCCQYVTFKNTPAFQLAWRKALKASMESGEDAEISIVTDTIYPDGAQGNFPDPELQQNHHEEKAPPRQGGVESHDAVGGGIKSD
jgi:hypothetical protein